MYTIKSIFLYFNDPKCFTNIKSVRQCLEQKGHFEIRVWLEGFFEGLGV